MLHLNIRLLRYMRPVYLLSFLTLIVVGLFGVRTGYFGSLAQSSQEDDFYYSVSKKIPVTVSLKQLGIVAKEEVSTQQITSFIEPLKMRTLREVSHGLYTLE